jgi:hypothetical protein
MEKQIIVRQNNDVTAVFWSGTSCTLRFEGTSFVIFMTVVKMELEIPSETSMVTNSQNSDDHNATA